MERKKGISYYNQAAAWVIFFASLVGTFVLPLNRNSHFSLRLFSVYVALAPLMNLLSIAYEMMFYACFGAQLVVWVYWQRAIAVA